MQTQPSDKFRGAAMRMMAWCTVNGGASEAITCEAEERFKECGLELHPEKTKIVYCKDGKRKGNIQLKFDFWDIDFDEERKE